MKLLKPMLLVISTGYIFVFYSEHLFWARVRPDDSLAGWLGAWLVYSIMALAFLAIVSHFRVKNAWGVFLAGATFGWMAEGIVVQTTYEMLPLSISFTGLAWHGLITIWVGWYAMQKIFHTAGRWGIARLASLVGVAYGFWAISWWVEPDGGISSIPEFAMYSFGTTGLALLAYWLAQWAGAAGLRFHPWVLRIVALLSLVYFVLVTAPRAPVAILLLPILFGIVYIGLRRNRKAQTGGSLLDTLYRPVSFFNMLSFLALPVCAVLVYALATVLELRWQTNWILYLVTTPLGFLIFGVSVYKFLSIKSSGGK